MRRVSLAALVIALVVASCTSDADDRSSDTGVPVETGAPEGTYAPVETEAPVVTDPPVVTEAPVATDPPPPDNTLVWVTSDEPMDLHPDDPARGSDMSSWIAGSLLEGLFGETESIEYAPELLASDGAVTQNADGSILIEFTLRDGLSWSDGTALTADDVKFTLDVLLAADGADEAGNPAYLYQRASRAGYDRITDFNVVSETEFSVTSSSFFPAWRSLFDRVFPSHVFSADPVAAANELNGALREWNTADGNAIPSSGPLMFNSWEPGAHLNLDTNPNYHGSVSPDVTRQGEIASVDGVRIDFVTDTDAEVSAVLAGDAQIVFSAADLAFLDLASSPDFTVASSPGVVFTHWGFNVNNPHLSKRNVREAFAYAMDKSEVVSELYTPLFGDSLPAEGLGNTYWLSNSPNYENHAGDAGYGAGDIASAQASLEAAGYVLNGDVYEHPDDGELSLRVGTAGGNRLREIQQELIQAQMADAGIDIVIDNVDGAFYFDEGPFSADALACATSGGTDGDCDIWDITQFPLIGSPEPNRLSGLFRNGSPSNPYGYQQPFFDQLADQCERTIDDAERAACYNDLDDHITSLVIDSETGLFMLPITQKPSFYGFTSALAAAAVAPDSGAAGPLVNVVDYVFAD